MDLAIIGTGYVGLVTGVCFAEKGYRVICIDVDNAKLEQLKKGNPTIYEPKLDALLVKNIEQKRLHFNNDINKAVEDCEIIFLALPTPPNADGKADLSAVLSVSKQIASKLKTYRLIVTKSTVPVGTTLKVKEIISTQTRVDFDVVSNPEFLREGFAIDDFMKPDRIIIGSSSKRATELMKNLYAPFVDQKRPLILMDEASCELTKYAANAFLATKITFINEMANFCERVGANINQVKEGLGFDPRIGNQFLNAGIGYGGSCFPKDVKALVQSGKELDFNFEILNSVEKTNQKQRLILLDKLLNHFKGNIRNKKIALWGLSFKPNTDDIREAPAVYLINKLIDNQADVWVYDPVAMPNLQKQGAFPINYGASMYEILEEADALLIVTEWDVFSKADLKQISRLLKAKALILDGRNIFDPESLQNLGVIYQSIGRSMESFKK